VLVAAFSRHIAYYGWHTHPLYPLNDITKPAFWNTSDEADAERTPWPFVSVAAQQADVEYYKLKGYQVVFQEGGCLVLHQGAPVTHVHQSCCAPAFVYERRRPLTRSYTNADTHHVTGLTRRSTRYRSVQCSHARTEPSFTRPDAASELALRHRRSGRVRARRPRACRAGSAVRLPGRRRARRAASRRAAGPRKP